MGNSAELKFSGPDSPEELVLSYVASANEDDRHGQVIEALRNGYKVVDIIAFPGAGGASSGFGAVVTVLLRKAEMPQYRGGHGSRN